MIPTERVAHPLFPSKRAKQQSVIICTVPSSLPEDEAFQSCKQFWASEFKDTPWGIAGQALQPPGLPKTSNM